VYKMRKMKMRK